MRVCTLSFWCVRFVVSPTKVWWLSQYCACVRVCALISSIHCPVRLAGVSISLFSDYLFNVQICTCTQCARESVMLIQKEWRSGRSRFISILLLAVVATHSFSCLKEWIVGRIHMQSLAVYKGIVPKSKKCCADGAHRPSPPRLWVSENLVIIWKDLERKHRSEIEGFNRGCTG